MEEENAPLTPSLNKKLAPSFSPPMSSIPGIIRKAIFFLLKNKKLMLQLFILYFFPFLILVLLHTLIALPLIGKVEDGFEKSALDLQDLIFLVIMEIPFAFAFCLLLLFASAITISAASIQSASLDLEGTLLSIKSTWKRVLVSGLYASFLKIAFVVVAVISTQLNALVPVMAALTFPCLASICSLVLVISTVDDECQGKMAVSRAREVAGQGRFLMLMLELLSVPAYVLFYVTATDDDDANGMTAQSGFVSVAAALVCLRGRSQTLSSFQCVESCTISNIPAFPLGDEILNLYSLCPTQYVSLTLNGCLTQYVSYPIWKELILQK